MAWSIIRGVDCKQGGLYPSSAGWVRIAKFNSLSKIIEDASGAEPYSVTVSLKRGFGNGRPENYEFRLISQYQKSRIILLNGYAEVQHIKTIRHVVDTNTNDSYIDIYYDTTLYNPLTVSLWDGNTYGGSWHVMPSFDRVLETQAGVNVLSSISTKSNFDVAHNIVDDGDGSTLSFGYSRPGLKKDEFAGTGAWVAVWNGRQLRAMSVEELRKTMGL